MLTATLLPLWFAFSLLVVPAWIARLHSSDLIAVVDRLLGLPSSPPLDRYLDGWMNLSLWAPFWVLALVAFAAALSSPRFQERHIGDATPEDLGAIRIVVAGVLLISACWEDLSSTALLPRELLRPMGLVSILSTTPLGSTLLQSESALEALQWLTRLVLLLCLIGWRTRIVLPIGVLLYLLVAGLLRHYSWFYHTGLVPLYLLFVLCFTPCGHGLSVDRWLLARRGRTLSILPGRLYGWSRYACWTTLAVTYLEAGLSKLRNGGFDWFAPTNLKSIVLRDSLNVMHFDWRLALRMVDAPDLLFSLLAIVAVASEIGFLVVLFSRSARLVLPALMAALHLSILFLQNVLFFDLILLQLIFYKWSSIRRRFHLQLPGRRRTLTAAEHFEATTSATPLAAPDASGRLAGAGPGFERQAAYYRHLILLVCASMGLVWLAKIEFYPLTALQMYSRPRLSGEIVYYKVHVVFESGRRERARPEQCVGAVADGRYKPILRSALSSDRRHIADAFFATCAERLRTEETVVGFDVERWEWNFQEDPLSPEQGQRQASYSYSVSPALY